MHFATLVNVDEPSGVYEALEPFSCEPEQQYLEFCDETESLIWRYKHKKIPAVKLITGKIISEDDLNARYSIKDGKIYELDIKTGKYKRTPTARKMEYIKDCPAELVFKTYRSFARLYECVEYNLSEKAFGYYDNPNAQWDWYSVGGRFENPFLVKRKEKCTCKIEDIPKFTPKGYEWVNAARICDIEWELMKKIKVRRAIKDYNKFAEMYSTGIVPSTDPYCEIDYTKKCVKELGSVLYTPDMSPLDYLEKMGMRNHPACNFSYNYLSIYGEWDSKDSYDDWNQFIREKIADADPESYLVMVDCHI